PFSVPHHAVADPSVLSLHDALPIFALIVLVVLWVALHERMGRRPFLFAGLVAAVMPVFHVHAYGTVLALAAFWALFNRRREWLRSEERRVGKGGLCRTWAGECGESV